MKSQDITAISTSIIALGVVVGGVIFFVDKKNRPFYKLEVIKQKTNLTKTKKVQENIDQIAKIAKFITLVGNK